MQVNDVFREKFSKDAARGFGRQTALSERGLFLGGVLLAKMGDEGLCLDGEEERILTLLSVARNGDVNRAALSALRRVSKHWQSGDKCLAAITLAQSGLGKLDAEGAYRLSLAAELLEAGVTPRELRRELGLRPVQLDVSKYDENQPRVPAGSGRASGQWTSGDGAAAGGDASTLVEGRSASATPAVIEGRSAATDSGKVHEVPDLPKDAVVVTRPDGTTIDDPKSPTKKLMAPPRANFQEVYAAGQQLAPNHFWEDVVPAYEALHHFGTYDFQRDKDTNIFFDEYVPAANYAIGVYMAGAGYTLEETYAIAEGYALLFSSNRFDYWSRGRPWVERGWEDAHQGLWKQK